MGNLSVLISLSGIKQEIVAREVGVSQATISFWKSGKKTPTVENAIALARLFGVSVGCVVDTEPVPEGYPDNYIRPVIYNEEIGKQTKAAEESKPFRQKKPPFNKEQIEYLDQWGDRLTERIVDSLREDTSLLRETGPEAN